MQPTEPDRAAPPASYHEQTPQPSLYGAAQHALAWIDNVYPPKVFTGESGDPGAVEIVRIRENLRAALANEREKLRAADAAEEERPDHAE